MELKNKIYCKCGCGEEVEKGNKYIHGHNRRGLPSYITPDGKWSMKYDQCIECGATELPHAGKGLCRRCHKRASYKISKTKDKWSHDYKCCIICGRSDRPHKAKGFCGVCYTNNLNRQMGVKQRNFGGWSWYHTECKKCGTSTRSHAKDGLCIDCYDAAKRSFSNGYEICPVCGVKVEKLSQHLSMRSKKCDKHLKYLYDTYKMYFDSDLGLDDIAKEVKVNRHTITRQFIKLFGKEQTAKRNKCVKSRLCSESAAINFNEKNRFGTVVYYESINNGNVRFRSKLEKQFAKILDKSGTKWVYEQESFPYIDKEGKRRTYTPDFYLAKTDEYIEIKGFDEGSSVYKINAMKKIGLNIKIVRKGEF